MDEENNVDDRKDRESDDDRNMNEGEDRWGKWRVYSTREHKNEEEIR